ncbi:MAG TPA: hypothetical protein VNY52_02000 [Solirubrobacteraceae bacterium]|jgi:hypothetical protein|nr:hypothetical protein [Solirubrobacteraceae bacterium]
MKHVRIVGLCLTAMFALGMVASTPALAVPEFEVCEEGGTEKWENHECNSGQGKGPWSFLKITKSYTVEGTSAVSTLKSKIGKEEIIIECKKDKFTGSIEPAGKTKGKVTFESCTVKKPGGCTVEIPSFEVTDQLVGKEDEFKPTKGEKKEVFVEIVIGTCVLKGTYQIKGIQKCELPSGETGKVEHEIVCTPAGGKLTLGKEKADFESTLKVKLTNGWAWRSK